MSLVLEAIARNARARGDTPVLLGQGEALSWRELHERVGRLAAGLTARRLRVVGTRLDNGPAWSVADLACVRAGLAHVPLPPFFSPAQREHALRDAGVQAVAGSGPGEADAGDADTPGNAPAAAFATTGRASGVELARDVAKVTYTSGSTGAPKGVLLTQAAQECVALSLTSAFAIGPADRHIALMPLGVLLENVAGLYAPLLGGATVVQPPLARVGMGGASGVDGERLARALHQWRATTAIAVPQVLAALTEAIESGVPAPRTLRVVAVGGAPVSPTLIMRARRAGIPAFEGYGLTECSSVLAVNRPGADRPGTVGRPLLHAQLRIAADGEVLARGALLRGYLHGAAPAADGWWPTGDLGHIDPDGFVHLTGRKKHVYATAFGRNVAPEWVERELVREAPIVQAAVFGEARPFNVAVVVAAAGAVPGSIAGALERANATLPDYARVRTWLSADEPFTVANGLWTGTGRARRQAIEARYRDWLERIYRNEEETVQ